MNCNTPPYIDLCITLHIYILLRLAFCFSWKHFLWVISWVKVFTLIAKLMVNKNHKVAWMKGEVGLGLEQVSFLMPCGGIIFFWSNGGIIFCLCWFDLGWAIERKKLFCHLLIGWAFNISLKALIRPGRIGLHSYSKIHESNA